MDGGGPSLNQFSKSKPQFVQQVRLVFDEDEQSFVSVVVLREQWGLLRVEADVVKFPLLSLFRREENREGDTCNFNTLHNY